MLNKKQLFGSMLMLALLSPVCVNAMSEGGDTTTRGKKSRKASSTTGASSATADFGAHDDDASAGHDHDDEDGSEGAAGAAAGQGGAGAGAGAGKGGAGAGDQGKTAGIMNAIDTKILYYANIPLQTALNKISAWGAKGKFVITLLAAYLGYSASGKVIDDVTSIPSTLKSIVGADCEESECRGAKDWTEAA